MTTTRYPTRRPLRSIIANQLKKHRRKCLVNYNTTLLLLIVNDPSPSISWYEFNLSSNPLLFPILSQFSHDLILCQWRLPIAFHHRIAVAIAVHVAIVLLLTRHDVLDEAEAKRSATILVAGELGDGTLTIVGVVEPDNTSTFGTTIALVLDLGLLNFADRLEEFDEVIVAG